MSTLRRLIAPLLLALAALGCGEPQKPVEAQSQGDQLAAPEKPEGTAKGKADPVGEGPKTQPKADPEETTAAYDNYPEAWRAKFTKDWRDETKRLEQEVAAAKGKAGKALATGHLELHRMNKKPYFNDSRTNKPLPDWKVGDYGVCLNHAVVYQIIDDHTVIVGTKENGPLAMVKGEPTGGLKIGGTYLFGKRFVHVAGTTEYKGGAEKVLLVESTVRERMQKRQ